MHPRCHFRLVLLLDRNNPNDFLIDFLYNDNTANLPLLSTSVQPSRDYFSKTYHQGYKLKHYGRTA